MSPTRIGLLLLAALGSSRAAALAPRPDHGLTYAARAPEGLVGDGRSVVRVRPDGFVFHAGGTAKGRLALRVGGEVRALDAAAASATFFPGGVVYRLAFPDLTLEVLHGAAAGEPYLVAWRARGAKRPVALEVQAEGEPAVAPREVRDLEALRGRLEAPYRAGLALHTPAPWLDRAVAFHRALLDLGFDGRLHVCELFRWRDVWSRDLGSGLVPGAQVAGRFEAARTTLDYDLRRYAAANPAGLKVTEDPSQGGSAEGTAWVVRAVWRDWLLSGDRAFLERAAATLRPWVRAWLDRDPSESGLLVDDTEWMDHSRFFLFPDGARVLYSNVLFAEGLGTFARIERTLGRAAAADALEAARLRSVSAINATLWNEETGAYDNLSLWGRRDARSCQENALAVVAGVVPADRVGRVLDGLRARNWAPAGSLTISPPMSHVPLTNDHNHKMWPWWNAVEAKARLGHGDVDGGLHLLERAAATLEDPRFPGAIEELTSPSGVTEGGSAFLTAAGSFLDAVYEGLLGVEVLEPGRARLRVAPNVPAHWREWRATVPLPGGELRLVVHRGRLTIRSTDPQVKVIEAPGGATVEGARRAPLSRLAALAPAAWTAPVPLAPPPPRPRRAALLLEPGIPSAALPGLPARRVDAERLAALDPADVGALVVAGNALPARTRGGADVRAALAGYLDRGGALVFLGATMLDRGTMGETSGVVDWYEHRPVLTVQPIAGWRVRASGDGPGVPRERERGQREGWARPGLDEAGWIPVAAPAFWETALGEAYDGWGWYRAHFALPADARGKVVVLSLGKVDDDDWTFVNGVPVGASQGHQRLRQYTIAPGSPAYAALSFGGDNVVAVEVNDHGGAGGLWEGEPDVGTPAGALAWTPVSPLDGAATGRPARLGVVSWGKGDFFASWEARRGAFGFRVDGRGARFAGPLAGLPALEGEVREAFTDFAVSRPWTFEPLAYTETSRGLLFPDRGERYPCAARLVNRETGGEIVLVAEAIARDPASGPALLRALQIDAGPLTGPAR